MSQLEDQLRSLLVRNADAVDVDPDINRVLDAAPVVLLTGRAAPSSQGPRGRRWKVVVAGVAAAACVVAGVVVATGRDSRDPVEVGPSADSWVPETDLGDVGGTVGGLLFVVTAVSGMGICV